MIGAGTIINPIVKIVTTVAVLAAVYLFIVKPVLDTTDKAIDRASSSFNQAGQNARQSTNQFDYDFAKQRAGSFADGLESGWPQAAHEVKDCIRSANKEVKAMKHCDDFGHTLVTAVQSDRSFALSYADSLDAEGRNSEGAQVRDCVREAGFRVAPMEHCRQLSDKLLFG